MTRLPRISARECITALSRAGFHFVRQQGSHYIMRCDSPKRRVVIPLHGELGVGLLKAIVRDAGLTTAEFIDLLL
jgi:predicted RNA binding protein YcfA (HicA-like mRNA interferase family)